MDAITSFETWQAFDPQQEQNTGKQQRVTLYGTQ